MPPSALSEILTSVERDDLTNLESVIEEGKQTFVSVGLALCEIRDRRLYRSQHQTFEVYCQTRWGWGARRANQLMDAAVVVQGLPKETGNRVSDSKTACELAKVPAVDRVSVIKQAATSGKVTTKSIRDAANHNGNHEEKPVIQLDKLNHPIPAELVDDWSRANEVSKKLWGLLTEVKDIVRAGIEDGKRDPIFAEILSPTLAEIDGLRYSLGQIAPHVLCDVCHGRNRKQCMRCKKRGFISKFLWKATTNQKQRDQEAAVT